jgi:two-component system OmpR family response regulator
MANILIVEDEVNVAALIRRCVEGDGHTCQLASTGTKALEYLTQYQPDVVILDLMLPEINGLDLCSRIRQSSKLGQKDPYIMMLSAKAEEIDRIIGFSSGADDYLPKPFSPVELMVRLRALLRRDLRQQSIAAETIETTHLFIDKDKRSVHLKYPTGATAAIELTVLEFDLLAVMANRPGRIWSRAQILDLVWGDEYQGDDRIIDAYIKRLRQKLCGTRPPGFDKSQFIHTAPGIGYSFADAEDVP